MISGNGGDIHISKNRKTMKSWDWSSGPILNYFSKIMIVSGINFHLNVVESLSLDEAMHNLWIVHLYLFRI